MADSKAYWKEKWSTYDEEMVMDWFSTLFKQWELLVRKN